MISSVTSGSGGCDTVQIQQTRAKTADLLVKAVDTDHDGKITQDELSQALDGQSKPSSSTAQLFKQLDQGNKGYITRQDLVDGMAKADQAVADKAAAEQSKSTPSTAESASGRGVTPSPAGGGSSKPAAAPSSASATTTYDPEDLNQDGTVTMQEKLEYAAKLYAAQEQAQGNSKANSVYA